MSSPEKTDIIKGPDPEEDSTEELTEERTDVQTAGKEAAPASPAVKKHLNEALVQKAQEIREQVRMLQERLAKIRASQGKVKEAVYQKVSADYTTRLEETRRHFLDTKEGIDQELAGLRQKETEVSEKVKGHEETLEEARFRHELGEYADQDFKKIAKQEQAILKQEQAEQSALQGAIAHYEELISGEEMAGLVSPASTPVPPKVPDRETDEVVLAEEEAPAPPPPPNVGASTPRAVDREGDKVGATAPPEKETQVEAAGQPTLLLYENGEETGQFVIQEELTMGRSPSNEVVLKEARVSRRHAVIRHTGDQYVIVDNNSSNGTYVNGEAITEQTLSSGDKLRIGSFELVFKL